MDCGDLSWGWSAVLPLWGFVCGFVCSFFFCICFCNVSCMVCFVVLDGKDAHTAVSLCLVGLAQYGEGVPPLNSGSVVLSSAVSVHCLVVFTDFIMNSSADFSPTPFSPTILCCFFVGTKCDAHYQDWHQWSFVLVSKPVCYVWFLFVFFRSFLFLITFDMLLCIFFVLFFVFVSFFCFHSVLIDPYS